MAKAKFYAIVKGRKPGIYTEWFGANGAAAQVDGFAGAVFRGFATQAAAQAWLAVQRGDPPPPARRTPYASESQPAARSTARSGSRNGPSSPATHSASSAMAQESIASQVKSALAAGQVVIFTDGACSGNPGPGGWGAVLRSGEHYKEISGGFQHTTNNRMELTACIQALGRLNQPAQVALFSDSSYVVRAIEQGWAKRWRARGWMRTHQDRAENADLWAELLALCEKHSVHFIWLRGHAGYPDNERCDQLAVAAAHAPGLAEDPGYSPS